MSPRSRPQLGQACTVPPLLPPMPRARHASDSLLDTHRRGRVPQEAQLPTSAMSSSLIKSFIISQRPEEGHITRCLVSESTRALRGYTHQLWLPLSWVSAWDPRSDLGCHHPRWCPRHPPCWPPGTSHLLPSQLPGPQDWPELSGPPMEPSFPENPLFLSPSWPRHSRIK